MDWLLERQPRIEKALAEKHLNEGSPVLYDLTSVWSYSRTCPLVDRGCSRDGKKGLPQIEFGLLCDAEGRPVAVEAFPGNASDPSTVAAQVGKLRDRFGLKRAVFVGDRGMITQARVREDLEPNGCDWIFALRVGPSLLKISVFHFRRLLALFGQNNNEEQCPEAEDGKSPHYFSRG